MDAVVPPPPMLETTGGDFPLHEYRLGLGGRVWSILHTGAVLTRAEETRVIMEQTNRLPYGVALWPSAIALAHEIAGRGDALRGRRVLELGAGTGLPGVLAASLGSQVVQTDRDELSLSVCRRNGERNQAPGIDYRLADWTDWGDSGLYDWLIGADVLYGPALHPHLRRIFETNLAPGGKLLLADPFRATSFALLEELERDGWTVGLTRWDVGLDGAPRPVGVFELAPP